MSHVATVDLEIRDLDALADAAKRCGLELVRGQTSYRWFGTFVGDSPPPEGFTVDELGKCEHAIRIPPGTAIKGGPHSKQPYEIGVAQRRDGRPGYVMLLDSWNGGHGLLKFTGGPECNALKQAYGLAVARQQLLRQGWTVQEQPQPDGSISLVAVGGRGAL